MNWITPVMVAAMGMTALQTTAQNIPGDSPKERGAALARMVAMVPIPHWQTTGRPPFGSAFAVDNTGCFVTTARLAEAYRGNDLDLVLFPARPEERKVRGKITYLDPKLDLAILQADEAKGLVGLKPGDTDTLFENQTLVALGAALGVRGEPKVVSKDMKDCLGVAAMLVPVASLWRREGKLELIQIDEDLNFGFHGGPLVNSRGALMGVLLGRVPNGRANQVIPIDRFRVLLEARVNNAATVLRRPLSWGAGPRPPTADVPTPLEGDRVTRRLPAAVTDVIPAAGGQALLLSLSTSRKIALFDVRQGRVTHYFPLDCDDYLVAASLEKLVVLDRKTKVLHRWDLASRQKELATDLPDTNYAEVESLAMGYASMGPMMLALRKPRTVPGIPPLLMNLNTMRPYHVDGELLRPHWNSVHGAAFDIRASADGSTFVGWQSEYDPPGLQCLQLNRGGEAWFSASSVTGGGGLELPVWDGSRILTSQGIYGNRLNRFDRDSFRGSQCLPTYDPGLFIAIRFREVPHNAPRRTPGVKDPPIVEVCALNDRQKLGTIEYLDELEGARPQRGTKHPLSIDKRIHLFPWAQLLVTLGEQRDELILRRFDLLDMIKRSGADRLAFVSLPPGHVARGQSLAYQPRVLSSRGGVQLKLESGPEGMRLNGSGILEWAVPTKAAAEPTGVVLSAKDAAENETFQSFAIQVE